jgi:hypothetical protein
MNNRIAGLKKNTIAFYMLFCFATVKAQSPNLDWVKQIGDNSGGVFILSSATDASGNLYMTGVFDGTVDFNPGQATVDLTDSGFGDVFITKIDSAGDFVWVKQIGRESYDQGTSIAVDKFNDIYVTGFFSRDSTDFDPGPGTNYLFDSGGANTFILKLDSAGDFIFAKQLGPGENSPNSLALDASDNILVTGIFGSTVDFDPGIDTLSLTSVSNDIYILKLNSFGNFIWVKPIDVNVTTTRSYSLAADAARNIYITGLLLGTVDFNPGVGVSNLTATSVFGAEYILKLDSSGNFNWVKAINGKISQTGGDRAIRVDDTGNSYTIGWFNDTIDFDPGTGVFELTNTATTGGSTYLLKLNASGNLDWAKQIGDPGNGGKKVIALDTANNLFVTGTIVSNGDFNPDTSVDILSIANGRTFVAKYTDAGGLLWAINFANDSGNSDNCITLNVDLHGNIVTTGIFQGTGDFDPGSGIVNLTSNSGEDAFIHKLVQNPVTTVNEFRNIQNEISVYPNPNSGTFNLEAKGKGIYIMTDVFGENKYSFTSEGNNTNVLIVSGLSNGIYFLFHRNNDIVESKKIVIQK